LKQGRKDSEKYRIALDCPAFAKEIFAELMLEKI